MGFNGLKIDRGILQGGKTVVEGTAAGFSDFAVWFSKGNKTSKARCCWF